MSLKVAHTETDAKLLVGSERSFTVAPAGFGKTELIARAIELDAGRSLILTHTHSGVNAMRMRLRRLGVSPTKFEVATIAGWALKYAASYPSLSGLTVSEPSGENWNEVYDASVELMPRSVVRGVLARTFSGVFVDEYQDCNIAQHEIVLAIADVLPCRLLGDPLQGIFDFKDPTVSWRDHVEPNFNRLPDLTTPHRWAGTNPELGKWLSNLRARIIAGEEIALDEAPLEWMKSSPANNTRACLDAANSRQASVVAVRKWARESHRLASKLSGRFGSMEELDCHALMDFARTIDQAKTGTAQAATLVDFAAQCFTKIGSDFSAAAEAYRSGKVIRPESLKTRRPVIVALNELARHPNARNLIASAREIDRYPNTRLYRRELWSEMKTTVLTFSNGTHESLESTAYFVRDRARRIGRRPDKYVVSRTLLIKGLEFDYSVVLDTDEFNGKEFYVAATRGTRGLTVLSSRPIVRFDPIENIVDEFG